MIDESHCETCLERWQGDYLGGLYISRGREVEEK